MSDDVDGAVGEGLDGQGPAGVLHRRDGGVDPVDGLEALGAVGAGGELRVRGDRDGPPQRGQVADGGQGVGLGGGLVTVRES